MPIDIALPIANETGAVDYTSYYDGGASIFQVVNYFGSGASEGLQLRANPAAPVVLADQQWDLYAFTHGFLSLQGDTILSLRLPRELIAPLGKERQLTVWIERTAAGQALNARREGALALNHDLLFIGTDRGGIYYV